MGRATLDISSRSTDIPVDVSIDNSEIILELSTGFVHNFVGVVYYASVDGLPALQPIALSAGQAEITVMTMCQPHGYQSISGGILLATEFAQADWHGNSMKVKAVFTGVQGATHARLFVTGNGA